MKSVLKIAVVTAFAIFAVIVATILLCMAECYDPPVEYEVSEPIMVCETELL